MRLFLLAWLCWAASVATVAAPVAAAAIGQDDLRPIA